MFLKSLYDTYFLPVPAAAWSANNSCISCSSFFSLSNCSIFFFSSSARLSASHTFSWLWIVAGCHDFFKFFQIIILKNIYRIWFCQYIYTFFYYSLFQYIFFNYYYYYYRKLTKSPPPMALFFYFIKYLIMN